MMIGAKCVCERVHAGLRRQLFQGNAQIGEFLFKKVIPFLFENWQFVRRCIWKGCSLIDGFGNFLCACGFTSEGMCPFYDFIILHWVGVFHSCFEFGLVLSLTAGQRGFFTATCNKRYHLRFCLFPSELRFVVVRYMQVDHLQCEL